MLPNFLTTIVSQCNYQILNRKLSVDVDCLSFFTFPIPAGSILYLLASRLPNKASAKCSNRVKVTPIATFLQPAWVSSSL